MDEILPPNDDPAAQLAVAQATVNEAVRREAAAVFDGSKLDRQPRVTAQARPAYPAELREAGVDFVVGSDGGE